MPAPAATPAMGCRHDCRIPHILRPVVQCAGNWGPVRHRGVPVSQTRAVIWVTSKCPTVRIHTYDSSQYGSEAADPQLTGQRWWPATTRVPTKVIAIPPFLKYLILAWGLPIGIVALVWAVPPYAFQSRDDFSRQTFVPARVWVAEKRERKGADYFELRIENPEGEVFVHRDPEPGPIMELRSKFPTDTPITVRYVSTTLDGNVLVEVTSADATILDFDDVMAEYASRRRFVSMTAGIWCVLANLIALILWKVDIAELAESDADSEEDAAEQAGADS